MVELFNQIVAQADERELLSDEHFSVDGTLIQAWASHKSFVPRDRKDGDDTNGANLRSRWARRTRSVQGHDQRYAPSESFKFQNFLINKLF